CVRIGEAELRVAGHSGDRFDRTPRHGADAGDPTADVARQVELSLGTRGIEALARRLRAVAQARIARPEVDARRGRLVGIVFARRRLVLRPAPRPDPVETQLLGDLLRGEGLELHGLEPGACRLQSLATALATRG